MSELKIDFVEREQEPAEGPTETQDAELRRAIAGLEQKYSQAQQQLEVEAADNDLLLTQLHEVQEELERRYLEGLRLETKRSSSLGATGRPSSGSVGGVARTQGQAAAGASDRKPGRPVGAVARVRGRLEFRLGALLVKRCRSVRGWLGMPRAMLQEVRAFRKEQAVLKNEKVLPLSKHSDAAEAERLKLDLTYRWGRALVKHGKTPWGWMALPFVLLRELRRFRRRSDVDETVGRVEQAIQRLDSRIDGTQSLLERELSKVAKHIDDQIHAGDKVLAKATERFRAAEERWIKERGELSQAREAERLEAQRLVEQLQVGQRAWADEKASLTSSLRAELANAQGQLEVLRQILLRDSNRG